MANGGLPLTDCTWRPGPGGLALTA